MLEEDALYPMKTRTAIFGGGCFWCTEAVFRMLHGVVSVEPGYAGGSVPHPTYAQVCTGRTGHAEVIRIEYNPALISFRDLLTVHFATHDPTTRDRQGNDVGPQYRSIVFYADEAEQEAATAHIAALDQADGAPVVTEVRPLAEFYPAEDYHRDYYRNNPNAGYCQAVISPKLEKARQQFAALLAEQSKTEHV